MKKSIWIALALGLTACVGVEGTPDQDWTPDEQVVPDPTNPDPSTDPVAKRPTVRGPLETCAIEPLWWTSDAEHRATPQHFEFTADGSALVSGADVFGSGNRAWRTKDGEVIYHWGRTQILGANRDQTRVLHRRHDENGQHIAVAPLGQFDSVVWSRSGEFLSAAIDGEGARVAVLTRESNEQRDEFWAVLEVVEIDSGAVLMTRTLDQENVAWWAPYGPGNIELSADGKHLAVGLVHEFWTAEEFVGPRVALYSEGDTGWTDTEIDVPFTAEENGYNGQIADIAFHPSSDRLDVVSATGQALAIDTATGGVVDQGLRGAYAANWDTYLPPLPASPVRWSTDGRVKFSVAPGGALDVMLGDETLGQFVAAEGSGVERHGWNPEVSNPVMGVAVAPSNDKFAVAFRRGIGVWGCAGTLPQGQTALTGVTLEATRPADSPHSVDLEITLEGSPTGAIWGYRLFVNGEERGSYAADSMRQYLSSEEPVEVRVDVYDAFGSVRSNQVRL